MRDGERERGREGERERHLSISLPSDDCGGGGGDVDAPLSPFNTPPSPFAQPSCSEPSSGAGRFFVAHASARPQEGLENGAAAVEDRVVVDEDKEEDAEEEEEEEEEESDDSEGREDDRGHGTRTDVNGMNDVR